MATAGQKIKEHRVEIKHSELALTFLREGEELLDKGDVIQASEKLYKAAEEAVKGLTEVYAADVSEEAMRNGRWTVRLLEKAIDGLASEFGEEVERYWEAAWFLHVEGFHETRLDINSVKRRLKYVKKLVELERNL
jgi:hypothetical protein